MFSFKEKIVFGVVFLYKKEVYVFSNWSTRLEKHQTLLRVVDFLPIFKNIAFFEIFKFFEIHH